MRSTPKKKLKLTTRQAKIINDLRQQIERLENDGLTREESDARFFPSITGDPPDYKKLENA